MAIERPRVVFDKHLDMDAFASSFDGWVAWQAALNLPKLPYVGAFRNDEDHFHLLQLGWECSATIITGDGKIIEKARQFGRCGSYGNYLRGVIVVPVGKAKQVQVISDLMADRLGIIGIAEGASTIETIRDGNLGVDLRKRQAMSIELCDCPWESDLEHRRKRYKKK